jgi:hypothetical protein
VNIAWVAGHTGGAALFDGTSCIVVKDNASLNPYALTLAAWVNPTDWAGNRRIVQKGAFDDQFRLTAEDGMLKFEIAGVGTLTTMLPPTGTWTHIAGTYDGTTLRLYTNGVQAASIAASGTMHDSPDDLYIGTKPPRPLAMLGSIAAGDYFFGVLDEVRLYGRALSAAEIGMIAQ